MRYGKPLQMGIIINLSIFIYMTPIKEAPRNGELLVACHRDITNPLLTQIRPAGAEVFDAIARKYGARGVTEFDAAVQTMMHLAARSPREVWQDGSDLDQAIELIDQGRYEQGRTVFMQGVEAGRVLLYTDLVANVASDQAKRLCDLYAHTPRVMTHKGEMSLASYVYDPANSPFDTKDGKGKIIMDGATEFRHPLTGEIVLQAHEEQSGVPINFQRISEETAQLIGDKFHYLHAFRRGVVSFGAFAWGDEYPFAMASYDNVNRGYKVSMLQHFGINSEDTMELTRGWNGGWSPEGTMSVLFGYAHRELARVGDRYRDGKVTNVLTAINPNLFGGAAFRAANFLTVGHKPAKFTYVQDESGKPMYAPRWAIEERLGVERGSGLKDHPRYCENGMPLFPTNEMLYLFDPVARKRLGQKPIYEMDEGSYNSK